MMMCDDVDGSISTKVEVLKSDLLKQNEQIRR